MGGLGLAETRPTHNTVAEASLDGLEGLRKILYKSRMSSPEEAIRDHFFESLDDARQILRLFDFLPNVYLYIKDASGRFVGMNEPWLAMRSVRGSGGGSYGQRVEFYNVETGQRRVRYLAPGRVVGAGPWAVVSGDDNHTNTAPATLSVTVRVFDGLGAAPIELTITTGTTPPANAEAALKPAHGSVHGPARQPHPAPCLSFEPGANSSSPPRTPRMSHGRLTLGCGG